MVDTSLPGGTYFSDEKWGDCWILKLDSTGGVEWQKSYGGIDSEDSKSIQQTSDGGYISTGLTYSFGAGLSDLWVLKLDSVGDIEWQKSYGGINYDFGHSIQQTSDGGYIVAGDTKSFGSGDQDIWVLKLNSSGSIQWQKAYGGPSYDSAASIKETSDGGFIIGGEYGPASDYWVVRLDSAGNIIWQKTYDGGNEDIAYSIQETVDAGHIVAGWTYSLDLGSYDTWVLKLDSTGNTQWQKTYGGVSDDFSLSIEQTSDSGYIVAGTTSSFGAGLSDLWVLKLDANGAIDPACTFISDTFVTPADSSGVALDTVVTPADTFANQFSTNALTINTSATVYEQCPNPTCIFCDEFDDGVLDSNWTYIKDTSFWSEDGNRLMGTSLDKKAAAIADPVFAGCTHCGVETMMSTAGGPFNRIWLLFHVQDVKTDYVELLAKEESDRWVLKHRIGKTVVAKAKYEAPIDPNVAYTVGIRYDGTNFIASIGGVDAITLAPGGQVVGGTVGLKVKRTVGTFERIAVTP